MSITYALYQYLKDDGSFDYDRYVSEQVAANAKKLRWQWVHPNTIDAICRCLVSYIPSPQFGLCHGTRRGVEQELFKQHFPDCVVLGTEIAPTSERFSDTIQWDFHDVKDEWINRADFVYSNSLDHSYDPQVAVDSWMKELSKTGLCFVEWWSSAQANAKATSVDCFIATVEECRKLLSEWGRLSDTPYSIVDVLTGVSSRIKKLRAGREGVVFVMAKME